MATIAIGDKAPEFSLYDQTKSLRSLSEFSGKNVVLAFYPGAFTGVCDKEMCTFRDSMTMLNTANTNVVGISIDLPFTARVFAETNQLSFPLLSDYNREVIRKYGLVCPNFAGLPELDSTQRAVILLNDSGVVQYIEITENPGIEPDYQALFQAISQLG